MLGTSADSQCRQIKVALMGLSGKLQHTEQSLGCFWMELPGYCALGDRGSTLCPLCPSWPRQCQLRVPVPAVPDIPQLSKAILTCPSHPSHCGRDRAAPPAPESTSTSEGLGLVGSASHPCLQGNVFQASYSKPLSLKYIVNPARKPKVPTRALCRPMPSVSYFLLTKIFPCYFISKCALMIWMSLDSTLKKGHGKYDLILSLLWVGSS